MVPSKDSSLMTYSSKGQAKDIDHQNMTSNANGIPNKVLTILGKR